jgi:hypothetical protein
LGSAGGAHFSASLSRGGSAFAFVDFRPGWLAGVGLAFEAWGAGALGATFPWARMDSSMAFTRLRTKPPGMLPKTGEVLPSAGISAGWGRLEALGRSEGAVGESFQALSL